MEEIVTGDLLMGDDSTPRRVLSTCSGQDELFKITPTKGAPWVCNRPHVMTLTSVGDVVQDIPLDELLAKPKRERLRWRLFTVPVDFPAKPTPVAPYLVGLWLGDGNIDAPGVTNPDREIGEYLSTAGAPHGLTTVVRHDGRTNVPYIGLVGVMGKPNPLYSFLKTNCIENHEKVIPFDYLTGSRETRLALLAGLLDTDGHYSSQSNHYEIVSRYEKLAGQIGFLARSLGLRVTATTKLVRLADWPEARPYYRLGISGAVDAIPCKVGRKTARVRTQIKRSNVTGFKAESIGVGDYYGFVLDGNGRFLLGDFTVTHNTSLLRDMPGAGMVIDVPQLEGGTEVLSGCDNIDIATVMDWPEIDEKFEYLKAGDHPYKWVAIDSVSAMQKLARRKIVKERPIGDVQHKTTQPEYGQINALVEELIYRFRTLPIFTIWIAQERKFSSDEEASIVGPDVQPACLNALMPSMMLVARYRAITTINGELERHFYLQPRADTYAKNRRVSQDIRVPAIIRDPNLYDVIRYLRGNKEVVLNEVVDSGLMTLEIE